MSIQVIEDIRTHIVGVLPVDLGISSLHLDDSSNVRKLAQNVQLLSMSGVWEDVLDLVSQASSCLHVVPGYSQGIGIFYLEQVQV